MNRNICIIGAGNIGSRHLQALAKVKSPLFIQVIDPSADSLKIAKTRYEEVAPAKNIHKVAYLQSIDDITGPVDIAIIATTSNIRALVTKQLVNKISVKYIIFEKILFDKSNQYKEIENLLSQKKIKAWVNCPRRMMPFYKSLKDELKGENIQYSVSGSQWGLACNTIHFIDHIAFLTDCYDFEIDTSHLNSTLVESKRKGFLELNGTLIANFKDGSFASLTNYSISDTPQVLQLFSESFRCLTLETENKSYISTPKTNWSWKLQSTPILFQSEMTNTVIDSLIKNGSCGLTPFDLSAKLHLKLFQPLLKFVNAHSSKKYDYYPFT